MKTKIIILASLLLASCASDPPVEIGADAETPDAQIMSTPAQDACARIVAAHDRLVTRCPDSLHGLVAKCSTVTGVLRPDSIEGCIRFHDNVPCAPGQILWSSECTDLFTVGGDE